MVKTSGNEVQRLNVQLSVKPFVNWNITSDLSVNLRRKGKSEVGNQTGIQRLIKPTEYGYYRWYLYSVFLCFGTIVDSRVTKLSEIALEFEGLFETKVCHV